MGALVQAIWQITLLRQGPQVLPASGFLLGLVLATHWLVGVGIGLFDFPLMMAMFSALVGTLGMVAVVQVILLLHRRSARFVQALTALAGCEVLLGLLFLPPSLLLLGSEGMQQIAAMVWLLVLGWNLAVAAHIFRHALSVPLVIGVVFAVAYTFISFVLMGFIAPAPAS